MLRSFGTWVIAPLLAGYTLTAMPQSLSDEAPTIHISTDLIEVPVLAVRPPFMPARGLTSRDFDIRLDNGPLFHPRFARTEASDPFSVSIALDADPKDARSLSQALTASPNTFPGNLFYAQDHVSVYLASCHLLKLNGGSRVGFLPLAGDLEQLIGKPCVHPALHQVLQGVIAQLQHSSIQIGNSSFL